MFITLETYKQEPIMTRLFNWLRGKKTYIMAICLFLTHGAEGMGWIDSDVATMLKGLFTGGGLAALRASKSR